MRAVIVILGLLAAAAAVTAEPASAQRRDLERALRGVMRPIGAILGAPGYSRRYYKARKAASRSRAPAVVQTRPAPAAAAAAVAGTTAAMTAGATQAEAKSASPPDTGAEKPDASASPAQPSPPPAVAPTAAAPLPQNSSPLPAPAPVPDAATAAATSQAKPEPKPDPNPEPKLDARSENRTEAKTEAKTEPKTESPPASGPGPRSATLARPAESTSSRSADQPPARQPPTAAPGARSPFRLGLTGPLTWPTAFEDVIGFTLWPAEYGERLRGHGIGDVLNTAMAPAGALASRIRPGQAMARADSRRDSTASGGGSLGLCGLELQPDEWPTLQVERSTELTSEQRLALAQLKTAIDEAAARIRASCRDDPPLTSGERLRAMQATLWTVHEAAIALRAPFAKFYDALSETQRQKFAAPASAQADPRAMSPAAIARLCGAAQSGDAMLRQAEQSLNLSRAQRASLDTFQKKSAEMGQFLMASCLKPVPSTPVERIDAAADRLTALIFAASTVNLALNDFYNQLDDGQRSRFDHAGR